MVIALIGFVVLENRKLARQAATLGRRARSMRPAVSYHRPRGLGGEERDGREADRLSAAAEGSAWLAPFMLGLSLLCIVIVVIILISDLDGPFIGPWG